MKSLKYLLVFLFFIVLIQSSFGYFFEVNHDGAQGASLYYCNDPPDVVDDCQYSTGELIDSQTGLDVINLIYNDTQAYHKKLFTYKNDKRISLGARTNVYDRDHFEHILNQQNFFFTPYLTPQTVDSQFDGIYVGRDVNSFYNKDLQGDICKPNFANIIKVNDTTINVEINSNLNRITEIDNLEPYAVPEDLLKDYYYMKTFVYLDVIASDGSVVYRVKPTISDGNYEHFSNLDSMVLYQLDLETSSRVPYVLLPTSNIPLSLQFDLTNAKNDLESNQMYGNYSVEASAFPIDLKCDFNNDSYLDSSESFQVVSDQIIAFDVVNPNRDGDGLLNEYDLCPDEYGYIENQGCLSEYTALVCKGGAVFNNEMNIFSCDYNNAWCNDVIRFSNQSFSNKLENFLEISNSAIIDDGITSVQVESLGTGYYMCEDVSGFMCGTSALSGYCYLRDNKVDETNPHFCSAFGEVFVAGEHSFYSVDKVPYGRSCEEFSKVFTCLSEINSWSVDNLAIYNELTTYDTEYNNVKCYEDKSYGTIETRVNYDGTWEINDNYDLRKIVYDPQTNKTYFINPNLSRTVISMPTVTSPSVIEVYKNDVNIRNDTIVPEYIALKAHQIKKFNDSSDAEEFVFKSYNLMTNLDIKKRIDNVSSPGMSRIKIDLDIPPAYRVNLTLYQVIPKGIAFEDINIINKGGSQFIVLDKDPVIGFYFNDSDGNESIEYEVPGDNEGGTIIITQEPILFNEGKLVINYRETNCNVGELQLFELDDLIDSPVYSPGSGRKYKVCITHLDEELKANSNNLHQHIFNYTHAENMSLTQMMNLPIDISVDNSTPIYWDMKIQKDNPSGTYSCLGSMTNEDNSLFGDCGYTTKRIWLHLAGDETPPTTVLSYPYIAHKIRVELSAEDNIGGSGVNRTYYCVAENGVDCSNFADFKVYDGSFFLVTCSEDWGCMKDIYYYSTDLEGNVEDMNVYELTLIDKGSACQVDCTAKPKPNRYLKECRNLNGCEYFPLPTEVGDDRGKYVAEQCHYMTEDSWVGYNSTHEIQCPVGPFRPRMFTSIQMLLTSLHCSNIAVIERNVLINGETVKMKIVFCGEDDD